MSVLGRIVALEASKLHKLARAEAQLGAEDLLRLETLARCEKLLRAVPGREVDGDEPVDEDDSEEDLEELKRRAGG
jgi:hypothetical protein